MAVSAQVADDQTKEQQGVPDLSALLFEIADAWRALDEFARRAFPDAK